MAYRGQRLGGGLSLKAAADAIPDDGLRVATACSFDEVGTVSSARGRQKANGDAALGGSGNLLGGFDGLAGTAGSLLKFRFLKRGTAVYTNANLTALTDATNLSAAYTTSLGTLVNARKGLTAPTWGASSMLSGFTYGGYAYTADGSAIQRHNITSVSALVVTNEAWGLVAPGYWEVPYEALTCTGTTVTFTHTSGHGYGFGAAGSPSYPYAMNVEFVGFRSIGGIPDNEINCLHFGGSGASGDIDVTSADANLNTAGTTIFNINYLNGAGAFRWQKVNVQAPSGGATALNSTLESSIVTEGGSDPAVDQIDKIYWQSGTAATQGYFRLKFSRGGGDYQITENIAYNATKQQVEDAILALSFFNSGTAATFTASVTGATTITFQVPTTSSTVSSAAGGKAGFIRQGPTLTEGADGALVGGTYYYAYTFYNGALDGSAAGAESNFSARVPIAVSTGAKVTLSNVLMGPVGTTARRIYRTDVDGRQLYFVGQIDDNTTTTFTDTARLAHGADFFSQPGDAVSDAEFPAGENDEQARGKRAGKRGVREAQNAAKAKDEKLRQQLATNLGLLADWVDHDAPPSDMKEVGLLGDTVFGISGNTLVFSRPAEPEHFPLGNRVTPGRNTSETLRQWLGFDGACIAYTSNALYRLSPISLDFGEVRFEEIESPVGLAGTRAVAALDGTAGHVFLAKNGVYLFDGTRVLEISHAIEPMFTDSANANYVNPLYMTSAIVATSRDRLYMTYATSSSGNDRTLIGDFEDPTNPKWTVISWGFTSMWRERADTYLMAGDSSGYVYVLDQGYTDDGSAIAWAITSKEFRFNGQTHTNLDEVVIDANLAGATTTLTVTGRVLGSTKTATYTLTDTGRQRIKRKLPTHFKVETAQIALSSSHAGQRLAYEWGFTGGFVEDEP